MLKKKAFILSLIVVMSDIIGCAKKEEKKMIVLPPQVAVATPELYVPETYEYKSLRMRDPFVPLIASEKKTIGMDKSQNLLEIDITNLELTGIVWDKKESMAILHDGNKFGYILKRGRLYADNFKPIKGIYGKILGDKTIFLAQGKTEVNFCLGKSKITNIKGTEIAKEEILPQKEVEEFEKEKKF